MNQLRAWWAHRQGLDGSLDGASPADVLARAGWARSVGGVGPYLTLFSRAGTSRAAADAAVAKLAIHELPAARACTYVVPADDFALALALAEAMGDQEMKVALKLGVTEREIDKLCTAVLDAVDKTPRSPDEIRAATGDASRSLGDAGKKKGMSSTLPIALGRLQRAGELRRVPVNGRLDQQRYSYVRWTPNPRKRSPFDATQAYTALAGRFFRWAGPATVAEWQWYSGLGVKASAAILAPLGLVTAPGTSDRLLFPDDAEALRTFKGPKGAQYALVSSLDPLVATRRNLASHLDDADVARQVVNDKLPVSLGSLSDLPSDAIVDRGRVIGLWEFDPEKEQVVWATFDGARPPALRAVVTRTETYVRDELGDARSFSLDSPNSRKPRLQALANMR